MRQTSIILLFAFVLAGTSPALAQRRVPNTGIVGDVFAPPLIVQNGSFWTVAIGAKAYFGR